MIFVKVDVGLPRHHRSLRIPSGIRLEAIGLWLMALCYSREQELDGWCPLCALAEVVSGPDDPVLVALVDVGLMSLGDKDGVSGVIVLRYAEHNETKAEIAERRAHDRSRKSGQVSTKPRKTKGQNVPPKPRKTKGQNVPPGIRVDSGTPGSGGTRIR